MDFNYPPVCADCENKRKGKKHCFHGNKTIEHARIGDGSICFLKALNEEDTNKACAVLAKHGL